MSWHIRSVRARILLLVLVPVLSLFGLYLFTTGIAGKDALNLARARALKSATSEPVSNFLGQLDTERVYSAIYLSAPSPANLAKLRAQEAATAHVTAALHAALTSGSTLSNAPPAVRQASATLLHDAAGLPGLHASIAARSVSRDAGAGHVQQADQRLLPAAEPGDPHRDQHADRRAGPGAGADRQVGGTAPAGERAAGLRPGRAQVPGGRPARVHQAGRGAGHAL